MRTLTILLAAVTATAAAERPTEPYTSKAGGYSARFPGVPKEETRTQAGPAGDVQVHLAVYAQSNGTAYLTAHHDHPGPPPADQQAAVLEAVVKGATGADGKLAEAKELAFGPDKLPGRAYRVDRGKSAVRGVVVLKGGRVYQAVVAGPKDAVTGKDASAFLESLTLTK